MRADGDMGYFHSTRTVDVYLGKELLGRLGEIHPRVLDQVGIKGRVSIFEFDLELFLSFEKKNVIFKTGHELF